MKGVTGIGGIFFKAKDAPALVAALKAEGCNVFERSMALSTVRLPGSSIPRETRSSCGNPCRSMKRAHAPRGSLRAPIRKPEVSTRNESDSRHGAAVARSPAQDPGRSGDAWSRLTETDCRGSGHRVKADEATGEVVMSARDTRGDSVVGVPRKPMPTLRHSRIAVPSRIPTIRN